MWRQSLGSRPRDASLTLNSYREQSCRRPDYSACDARTAAHIGSAGSGSCSRSGLSPLRRTVRAVVDGAERTQSDGGILAARLAAGSPARRSGRARSGPAGAIAVGQDARAGAALAVAGRASAEVSALPNMVRWTSWAGAGIRGRRRGRRASAAGGEVELSVQAGTVVVKLASSQA
jgi:hypothetical protein